MFGNVKRYITIILASSIVLSTSFAFAWTFELSDQKLSPKEFIRVSKINQELFLHRGDKTPFSFPSTTGQVDGDKVTEGDLKTPEGVYFIIEKIPYRVDFALYGDIAYPLNYPNPVDRLDGKTGHGIWIHGRGKEFLLKDTEGCVALENPNITAMSAHLKDGLPVLIGKRIDIAAEENEALKVQQTELYTEIETFVNGWADSWSTKSNKFFDFYDKKSFEKSSGVNFADFQKNKERLFSLYNWIEVAPLNIQILPAKNYYVVWFDQLYRTGMFESVVHKRLYLKRDDKGALKIVGREMLGIADSAPLRENLLATQKDNIIKFVDSWIASWKNTDLAAYTEFYADNAKQANLRGKAVIKASKQELWGKKGVAKLEYTDIELFYTGKGYHVELIQEFEDNTGYKDTGKKILFLIPSNKNFKIQEEYWRGL